MCGGYAEGAMEPEFFFPPIYPPWVLEKWCFSNGVGFEGFFKAFSEMYTGQKFGLGVLMGGFFDSARSDLRFARGDGKCARKWVFLGESGGGLGRSRGSYEVALERSHIGLQLWRILPSCRA